MANTFHDMYKQANSFDFFMQGSHTVIYVALCNNFISSIFEKILLDLYMYTL